MNKGGVFGATIVAAAGLFAARADAGDYQFTLLSTGTVGKPAINNAGHVAYYAREPVTSNVSLYVWDGTRGILAIRNDQNDAISSHPVIADGDRVAMTRYNSRETVVWDPVNGERVLYPGNASRSVSDINSAGMVVMTELGMTGQDVWVGDGGPATRIRTSATGGAGVGVAAINNAGAVAVYERNGSLTEESLQLITSGPPVEIASRTTGHRYFTSPSISDSGYVAFASEYTDGTGGGVHLYGNGQFSTVVGGSGFRAFGVAVNDFGEVAYRRISGTSGIYVGGDPIAGKVIAAGDPLFGSTAGSFEFGPGGFNNRGELAFFAMLQDGRTVSVLAQPLPEPAFAMFAGILAVAVLSRRRQRPA